MEQDIQENDRVMLRYKFSAFFDLKPKVSKYAIKASIAASLVTRRY